MIDSDELLAIGAALVETVRSQIKYSTNMNREGQLFDGLTNSKKYNDLYHKFRSQKRKGSYIERAKKAIDLGSGFCGELARAVLYIADMIDINLSSKVYTTVLFIEPDHSLVLLHTSERINLHPDNSILCKELNDLQQNPDLKDSVLVDPWIYCAKKSVNINELLVQAESFNVLNYYENDKFKVEINRKGDKSFISSLKNDNSHTNKYQNILDIFYMFYEEQKQKLASRRDSFARGRRFSSVRNDLILDVYRPYGLYENQIVKIQSNYRGYLTRRNIKQQQQQQLISLKDFFTRLNNQSSYWYSHFGHSNTKGTRINETVTYLTGCINNTNYPGEAKLINLFQCILRILPIVRSSNTAPRNLSVNSIDMTKSAKGIFNLAITPQEKYAFENINGLNLDWIRAARNLNDIRKYEILLEKITEFTAPNDLGEILRNFYENKNGYYQLVRDAITH